MNDIASDGFNFCMWELVLKLLVVMRLCAAAAFDVNPLLWLTLRNILIEFGSILR